MRHPEGPSSPEEEKWASSFESDQELENGYRTQQATKPQTLAYAMMDSPVGTAAWITENTNRGQILRTMTLKAYIAKTHSSPILWCT